MTFFPADDMVRTLNTVILALTVYPAFIVASRSFHSHSTLSSIRYVLTWSFLSLTFSALVSIYINLLVFHNAPIAYIMTLANIRNLVKNTGVLVLVFGLYRIHGKEGDSDE